MDLSDEQLDELQDTLDALLSEAEILQNDEDENIKVMFNFQRLLDLGKPISSKNIADLMAAMDSYEAIDQETITPYFETIREHLGD